MIHLLTQHGAEHGGRVNDRLFHKTGTSQEFQYYIYKHTLSRLIIDLIINEFTPNFQVFWLTGESL